MRIQVGLVILYCESLPVAQFYFGWGSTIFFPSQEGAKGLEAQSPMYGRAIPKLQVVSSLGLSMSRPESSSAFEKWARDDKTPRVETPKSVVTRDLGQPLLDTL
jgi:hypothetical protein